MIIQKPIRVILADDHPMIRRGIRRILEKCPDIQVIGEAGTGAAAIRLVYELKPDVLVLDVEMPDMTGNQVAHELRSCNVPVSILVLSACDDIHFIQETLRGVDGYVHKGERPEILRQAVYLISKKSAALVGA